MWQTMETAPTSECILGYFGRNEVYMMYWNPHHESWSSERFDMGSYKAPRYWMRIPLTPDTIPAP